MSVARLIVIALALSLSSSAAAERLSLNFTINDQQRDVLVYVPDQAATQVTPLVVVYHGRGDDAEPFARAVKLHEDWPQAIVAYPRGEWHDNRPQRGWQYRAGQYDDRDLKLTDALLAELGSRYVIEPTQTFAAGFSNGGHFLFLMMKLKPERFAAYTIIGAVQPDYENPASPRPLLYLFGKREDRHLKGDWEGTVQALVKHQRTAGPLSDALGCCKLHRPTSGGAPFVFGNYNAGHIWPADGNRWIKQFFADPWFGEPTRDDETKAR